MIHFSQEELDRVREAHDLREFIPASPKRQHHRDYDVECCSFHQDISPSMTIHSTWFKCFGCNAKGSIFDYVMLRDHIGFVDAVLLLGGKPDDQPAESAAKKFKRRFLSMSGASR